MDIGRSVRAKGTKSWHFPSDQLSLASKQASKQRWKWNISFHSYFNLSRKNWLWWPFPGHEMPRNRSKKPTNGWFLRHNFCHIFGKILKCLEFYEKQKNWINFFEHFYSQTTIKTSSPWELACSDGKCHGLVPLAPSETKLADPPTRPTQNWQ